MLGKQEIRAVNISFPYNIIQYPFFDCWIALQLYLLSLCDDKEVNFDKRATQRKKGRQMQACKHVKVGWKVGILEGFSLILFKGGQWCFNLTFLPGKSCVPILAFAYH